MPRPRIVSTPRRLVSRGILGLLVASAAVAACGSDGTGVPSSTAGPADSVVSDPDSVNGSEPATDTGAATTVPDSSPSAPPTTERPELSPTQRTLADVAVADLVDRRSVDAEDISVAEVSEVVWRDSSLGCPQEGMQYLQVLTPGVRVVLEVDGDRASYHGTSAEDLTYCATPQSPIPD